MACDDRVSNPPTVLPPTLPPCMSLCCVLLRYHEPSLRSMRFFDDNTRSWWSPITGGANVPALNELLASHGIAFGDSILTGKLSAGRHTLTLTHGADVAVFPSGARLLRASLTDAAATGGGATGEHAAFGVALSGAGRVAVMGDSNCLDSSHNVR